MLDQPKVKEEARSEVTPIHAELSAGGVKMKVLTRSEMVNGRLVRLVVGVPPVAGTVREAPGPDAVAALAGMGRAAFGMR